jgi:uncharacterized phage-associated protein
MATEFDPRKFRELVLFIAQESADPRFGATKLNKILYFSDFKAFGIRGESITGATYQRLDRGPAPVELLPMLRELEDEEEITREERFYYNRLQKVVRVTRPARLETVLEHDEIELVKTVLRDLRELNASQVSALSHLEIGWRLARDRELIPYETAYVSDRKPTSREVSQWEQDVEQRRSHQSAS